ncbi:alpha/beta fold hydrolase [Kiritimatiellaeota bacterium B1221]|nr:alpha/beta fold hydrolase [Kiritimatiellaeota bacterium B1221]
MKLKVREFGQGRCRGLWLHGWLGTGREGEGLQKALGENSALCCPDLPGHGETQLSNWSLDATLDAIADLAQSCEWAGGYSLGGRLLMMAARRHPEAFKSLVIESASLGLVSEEARKDRRNVDHQRAEQLRSQGLKAFCESWYRMDMWGGFTDFPDREGDAVELAGALELFSVADQPDLRSWIRSVTYPILWLAGEKDPVYAAQAKWVANNTSHRVEIVGAGHNVHLQARGAWEIALQDFLKIQGA